MDNLKSPASPQIGWEEVGLNNGVSGIAHYTDLNGSGFTKLEMAALMVVGHLSRDWGNTDGHEGEIARKAINLAAEVLEQANK